MSIAICFTPALKRESFEACDIAEALLCRAGRALATGSATPQRRDVKITAKDDFAIAFFSQRLVDYYREESPCQAMAMIRTCSASALWESVSLTRRYALL